MATHIFNTPAAPVGAGLFARIANAAPFVSRTFAFAVTAQSRVDQIRRLQALSDEQLAERGLDRDQIVHHVYKDLFHD